MRYLPAMMLATLLLRASPAFAQEEEVKRMEKGFTLGAGYVEGGDCAWVLGDFWNSKGYDLTHVSPFLNLEAGAEFRVLFQLYFNPRLRWLLSSTQRVGIEGYVAGTTHSELISIVMPDLSLKYYLFNIDHHFFYASCSFGGIMPFTGNPELALTSNGIELGYGGGYQYVTNTFGAGLEVQYATIPVKVTSYDPVNFGGWTATVLFFF